MEFRMIDKMFFRRFFFRQERKIKVLFIVFAVIQRVLSCEFLLPKKTKPSKKYHRDLMLRFHKQTQKEACSVCGVSVC